MSTKLKITESQFDKAIYAALSEPLTITEAEQVTKSDVEVIAKKTIKSYLESGRSAELENRVKAVVHQMIKSDSATEKAIVEIAKNVLVQLYKSLWTKRSFWTSDLRNAGS